MRLFAQMAEIAGTREIEVDGATVADVLERCSARFGPAFSEQLGHCTVWVDAEKASDDTEVGPSQEVAVLPPVSGGR